MACIILLGLLYNFPATLKTASTKSRKLDWIDKRAKHLTNTNLPTIRNEMLCSDVLCLFKIVMVVLVIFIRTGKFSDWNSWSSCSAHSCGNGYIFRERLLKGYDNDTCYSAIIEKKECRDISCDNLTNLALNKNASASSQFLKTYPAGNAVDGITTNTLRGKSCMHTGKDDKPWLKVDFGEWVKVYKVIVYNRFDCCSERLNNLMIWVDDVVCGERNLMENVNKTFITCVKPMFGQAVMLTIPGPQFLHVCEIKVLGLQEGVLNTNTATQSTTQTSGYSADKALDNNLSTWTHTVNGDTNPWWKVDMGDTYYVTKVMVHGYILDYSSHSSIEVIEKDGTTHICGNTETKTIPVTVVCGKPAKGRFVRISRTNRNYLILKEVKIFGFFQ